MTTLPALLLAAAGIGFGHAVLPDHWMPLAVLSRTRRYPARRVLRLSLAAGIAHVLVSLLLGSVLMLVGLRFRETVARHTDLVVGGILLLTGVVFGVMALLGRGHGHPHGDGDSHDHSSSHDHASSDDRRHHDHDDAHGQSGGRAHGPAVATLERPRSKVRVAESLVPFGAAASPDLTILPVFLAAGALGPAAAVGTLAVFALTTIATIAGLTTAAAHGARQLTAPWIDRSANLFTAGTLVVVGALVTTGVI